MAQLATMICAGRNEESLRNRATTHSTVADAPLVIGSVDHL